MNLYDHVIAPLPYSYSLAVGSIYNKGLELGHILGNPVDYTIRELDDGGYYQRFQGGVVYYSPTTGAHEVHGAILGKWADLGWERSFLGYPTTDESPTPDGVGRFNHFQGGSIYWTPQTGANTIYGAIRDKWADLGWENSFLGYPTTDELPTLDGVGRFNNFQGGSIYWTPQTGANEVHGAILGKWASLGHETGFLGYPVTDELPTPDGVGRFNYFQGGSIYWTPNTGAHEVHGDILLYWGNQGYERGFLGYPMSDEQEADPLIAPGGRYSVFEGGVVYWDPSRGARMADNHNIPKEEIIKIVDEKVLDTNDNLYLTGPTELTKVHHWYNHEGKSYYRVMELDYDLKYSRRGRDPEIDLDLFLSVEVDEEYGNISAEIIRAKHSVDMPFWFDVVSLGIGTIMEAIGNREFAKILGKEIGESYSLPNDFSIFQDPFAAQLQDNGSLRVFGIN